MSMVHAHTDAGGLRAGRRALQGTRAHQSMESLHGGPHLLSVEGGRCAGCA